MFELRRIDRIVEVRVEGVWPREEFLQACAAVRDDAAIAGVLFDLRAMTNVPAPGRGPALANELPQLLQGRNTAFVVALDTAVYGVVHQITAMSDSDIQMFTDRESALAWLAAKASRTPGAR